MHVKRSRVANPPARSSGASFRGRPPRFQWLPDPSPLLVAVAIGAIGVAAWTGRAALRRFPLRRARGAPRAGPPRAGQAGGPAEVAPQPHEKKRSAGAPRRPRPVPLGEEDIGRSAHRTDRRFSESPFCHRGRTGIFDRIAHGQCHRTRFLRSSLTTSTGPSITARAKGTARNEVLAGGANAEAIMPVSGKAGCP